MSLSPSEHRIHAALCDYLNAVHQGKAGSPDPLWAERLKSSSQILDSLSAELSPQLSPQLSHFLESKSYRKAHDFLSALASSGLANPPAPRQACAR